jgi:SSS family solute:Na+ symporter
MFWKRATGHGAFFGLLSGTCAAALTHGLTVAEGKGGWLGQVHEFPSSMAQNFWIAIIAWTVCFVMTILVSLASAPRPERELVGLVYGLTPLKHDEGVSWYKRPVPLAIAIGVLALILNFWFA